MIFPTKLPKKDIVIIALVTDNTCTMVKSRIEDSRTLNHSPLIKWKIGNSRHLGWPKFYSDEHNSKSLESSFQLNLCLPNSIQNPSSKILLRKPSIIVHYRFIRGWSRFGRTKMALVLASQFINVLRSCCICNIASIQKPRNMWV